jgi:hypothetical protein
MLKNKMQCSMFHEPIVGNPEKILSLLSRLFEYDYLKNIKHLVSTFSTLCALHYWLLVFFMLAILIPS